MPTAQAPALRDPLPSSEPLDLQRLYEEHGDFIRAVLARLLGPSGDPDDLTQEVFLLAWRKLAQAPTAAPRAWLCQIAIRLATNARRLVWVRRALGLEAAGDRADPHTPEDLAEAHEATRNIYAIANRLSEKKRTVFILYEIQGLSGEEIAAAIDCPISTVHTRLHHARREFMAHYARAQLAEAREGGARAC